MTKEVLKLALEALELHGEQYPHMVKGYCLDAITAIKEALAQPEQEPVGKLQEATAERAWFTIAELNAWADKKLSENPHWVMPKDEPERDEPPPQRTWVGLTDIDYAGLPLEQVGLVRWAEAKLKEKNS